MELYILLAGILIIGLLAIFLIEKRRKRLSPRDIRLIVSEWRLIQEKLCREPRHALIEADRLLDFVLKRKGYNGSLAEKLKKAEKLFSSPEDIWKAHKLRNKAVHEVGFHAGKDHAEKAISFFKQALWDLGVKL